MTPHHDGPRTEVYIAALSKRYASGRLCPCCHGTSIIRYPHGAFLCCTCCGTWERSEYQAPRPDSYAVTYCGCAFDSASVDDIFADIDACSMSEVYAVKALQPGDTYTAPDGLFTVHRRF